MQIEEHISLAHLTSLQIGGPARFFCRATTESELLEAVRFGRDRHLPLFVLGGGSNLVVSDQGFPGLVVQAAIGGPVMIDGVRDDVPDRRTVSYDVPAGYDWDEFVLLTCEARLSGVECMAGIPGWVGGSPVQNVGAYGQEVSQTLSAVRVLDLETLAFETLKAEACAFSYRTSLFNTTGRNRFIITRVSFDFSLDAEPKLLYADLQRYFAGGKSPTPLEIYAAVRMIREGKGMLINPAAPSPDTRSAGSFFKNPVVARTALARIAEALSVEPSTIPNWPAAAGALKLPAAWLIEQAGFPKGFTLGPVGISSRHTLALTNRTGTATCTDLIRLRDTITDAVAQRFGITLEQEPVFLA